MVYQLPLLYTNYYIVTTILNTPAIQFYIWVVGTNQLLH